MEKHPDPLDRSIKEAMKGHRLTPNEQARKAFLKEASSILPPRKGWKYWYFIPVAVIFLSVVIAYLAINGHEEREVSQQSAGGSQQSAVGSQQSAVGSQQSAVNSQQSAVSSQQSAVGSQQSAVGSQQSAVSSQQLAVSSQQSAVGSQQLAVSSQQSAVGSQQEAVSSQQLAVSSQQSAVSSQKTEDRSQQMPVTTDQQPVSTDPEPVTNDPKPVTNDPEPVTNDPEPVTNDPEPVTNDPEPVTNDPEPVSTDPEPTSGSENTWRFATGLYYLPEVMFNTVEGNKYVHNTGIDAIFYYGLISVRTGLGVSVSKGITENSVQFNDYLGTYNKLDSISFTYNEEINNFEPSVYTSSAKVWDSIEQADSTEIVKRYTYFQVPLVLGFDFWQKRNISIGVRIGTIMSVLLNEKQLTGEYDSGENLVVGTHQLTPSHVSLNWQAVGGFAASAALTEKLYLEIEPQARYYYGSIYEKSGKVKKPWSVGLRLAAVYKF